MATYRVEYMRNDQTQWHPFTSGTEAKQIFTSLTDAYNWAQKRSAIPANDTTLYRVWNIDRGRQEGSPYLKGKTTGAQLEANRRSGGVQQAYDGERFTLELMGSGLSRRHFDSSARTYSRDELVKRCDGTCFTGKHEVWVTDSRGHVVYNGTPTTKALTAWAKTFVQNAPFTYTQEASEMEYEARKALNVRKEVLVEKMEATIAEAKAKHDENKTAEEAALADRITALKKLVKDNPAGVVKTLEGYISGQFFAASTTTGELENAKKYISNYDGSTAEFVPDPTATKLISVLNAAVDETIEVTPSDDFYRYL